MLSASIDAFYLVARLGMKFMRRGLNHVGHRESSPNDYSIQYSYGKRNIRTTTAIEPELPFLTLQKPFRIDRRHATSAGRSDRLAVDVILHVAAGKHAGDVGLGTVVGDDVACRVEI
jgi:hypothetical protein